MYQKTKIYDYYEGTEMITTGTLDEIAEFTGFSKVTIKAWPYKATTDRTIIPVGKLMDIYELSQDGEVIATGTMESIAQETGLAVEYVRTLTSRHAHRKTSWRLKRLEGETVRVRHTTFDHKAYKRAQVREREEQKEIKKVPAKKAEWHPSKHVRYLHNQYFKKWGVEA